jgi:hypothetical protein
VKKIRPSIHRPSAGEVAEEGVKVVRDAATDAKGVVVHGDTREPVTTGEEKGERKTDENAA